MRILSGLLENFCQIRRLEFRLSPGLNAFLGPNGSGKSNTLKAVYGALTNDFSRNPGTKEQNVSQLAAEGEKALVRLEFEHQGATYHLTRSLKPAKQEFLVPGEKALTRDAQVNQRVLQVLGVTAEILDKYIFVDQWAMFDFLTATETERAKAFQRLFGTLKAEKAWAAVGDVLNRTEVPQVLGDIDEVRRQLIEARTRLDGTAARLAAYADLPERPDPGDEDAQAVKAAARRQALDGDIARMETRLREWGHDLTDKRQEQVAFLGDRDVLRDALAGGREALDAAKAALANWRTLKSVQQSRDRVTAQLERVRQEEALHPKPNRNGLYVSDLDGPFHARHEFLTAEVARAERFLSSFDAGTGCTECPTCFTPVGTLQAALAEARAALPALKAELAEMDRRLAYTDEVNRHERAYHSWVTGWRPRVEALEQQLADLQHVERPSHDEATLAAIVAEAAEVEQALGDNERELAAVSRELAQVEGKIQGEEARLRAARAERDALRLIEPEELADIEQRIAARTAAFQDRARLRGQQEAEQRQRDVLLGQLERLNAQAAEAERARRWVTHLGDVRTVLHRDNLPRIVADHYLRELQGETNEYLSSFEAPFRVTADDKLSFTATFHDGRSQPAGRLSGGEKVVLALAFRLSVNSMFAQDVGLLCLDEPTVGLDEHNLGCLQTALLRLKDLSRSRGLQVVLVTHERSLGHLFDQVVDLTVAA